MVLIYLELRIDYGCGFCESGAHCLLLRNGIWFFEFCPLLLGFLLPFDPKWTSAFCDMAFILSSSFI